MNKNDDLIEFLCKEVYAHFGLTYYFSECLHRGLCNYYALYSFRDKTVVTRARTEELLSISFKSTFGQVLEKTKKFHSPEISKRLDVALEIRNFLAHHFWFDRIHLMAKEPGLRQMIEELQGYESFFQEINRNIEWLVKEKIKEFGIEEFIDDLFNKALKGEVGEEEPLIQQRFPKKKENVIQAWNLPIEGGTTTVLETDDGCLWQFCDVGLGWTFHKKPVKEWKIDTRIQKYLPATINPRPEIKDPWNYEFKLNKGAILFVKKRSTDKIYRWGIRFSHNLILNSKK